MKCIQSILIFSLTVWAATALAQEQDPPVCFTDTFDDESSLANWRMGDGATAEISDDGQICLQASQRAVARFRNADGIDHVYEDFHFTVDMEYENTGSSDSGVFARGGKDNLGTYLLYFNNGNALQILRVSPGGGFASIAESGASAPAGTDRIRYEFIGKGNQLTGRVYTLDNPDESFGEVTVTDDVYPSGVIGLVGLDNGVDVCYDNFRVLDPENPDGCEEEELPLPYLDDFGDGVIEGWKSARTATSCRGMAGFSSLLPLLPSSDLSWRLPAMPKLTRISTSSPTWSIGTTTHGRTLESPRASKTECS